MHPLCSEASTGDTGDDCLGHARLGGAASHAGLGRPEGVGPGAVQCTAASVGSLSVRAGWEGFRQAYVPQHLARH